MRLGGIEAGGTKIVCAVADEKGNVFERLQIPTTTPEETNSKIIEFFKSQNIDALGIASFGPIDLNENSKTYGTILRTPKIGWENVNMVTPFKTLGVPIGLDTDVNGAILGEVMLGAARNCESAIYITIGTGIGVGVYVNGKLLHGMQHPEAGHIIVERHPKDSFGCKCPFHNNCFEGLASGPAIEARWCKPANELYDNNEVWELESYYIAQAVTNYILCYSPQKVVLWGGVMHKKELVEMVRSQVIKNINGYVNIKNIDDYIVTPLLGDNAGVIGATQLGENSL